MLCQHHPYVEFIRTTFFHQSLPSNGNVYIGNDGGTNGDGGRVLDGSMKGLRIYGTALSASDIEKILVGEMDGARHVVPQSDRHQPFNLRQVGGGGSITLKYTTGLEGAPTPSPTPFPTPVRF